MMDARFETVNRMLEECEEDASIVREFDQLTAELGPSEQSDLVAALSDRALARAHGLQRRFVMHPEAREHLLWAIYMARCRGTLGPIRDQLLEQVLADYGEHRFLALTSVVVYCLKHDRLSEAQAERVEAFFGDRAVVKEAAKLRARRRVARGERLTKEQVEELLGFAAFDTLELALDRAAVGRDALTLFTLPGKGEPNRKHRLKLYEKAQRLTRGRVQVTTEAR